MSQIESVKFLTGALAVHKEELREKIQDILYYYNSMGIKVDLLCSQQDDPHVCGKIKQIPMVDISVRIE